MDMDDSLSDYGWLATLLPKSVCAVTAAQNTLEVTDPFLVVKSLHSSIDTQTLSGLHWVKKFPTSITTDTLEPSFKKAVNKFLAALDESGASYTITATYRPPERAYLMHFSYCIAREGLNPTDVPPRDGVNISWLHQDKKGQPDLVASRVAAEEMVKGYKIVHKPSLKSRHTERLAIDMNIVWRGNLTIRKADGNTMLISSPPHNGADNTELHTIGSDYGVHKLVNDPPHWSSDGH